MEKMVFRLLMSLGWLMDRASPLWGKSKYGIGVCLCREWAIDGPCSDFVRGIVLVNVVVVGEAVPSVSVSEWMKLPRTSRTRLLTCLGFQLSASLTGG